MNPTELIPAPDKHEPEARRSFLRRVGLAAAGASVAAPALGAASAQAGTQQAYVDDANTFTAPQTMQSSGPPPLTLKGDSPGYTLHVRDQATDSLVARLGSIPSPTAGTVAGVLVLHGTNGLGTYGAAWQVGVDVANPPYNRDFFTARVNADDSVRDIFYIWNNGPNASPAVDFQPAGAAYPPNASMAINGQNNTQTDPPLLVLRPAPDLDGEVLQVKVISETKPRFTIDKNGAQNWGPGDTVAPGGRLGAPGITMESPGEGLMISQGASTTGVQRILTLNNSRTTRAAGDGTRLAFMLDGFTMARLDATYSTDPAAGLSLQVATGNGTYVERISMNQYGIAFNGNAPFVPPAWGPATAGSKWTANERQMLQRLYNLLQALGFFK